MMQKLTSVVLVRSTLGIHTIASDCQPKTCCTTT